MSIGMRTSCSMRSARRLRYQVAGFFFIPVPSVGTARARARALRIRGKRPWCVLETRQREDVSGKDLRRESAPRPRRAPDVHSLVLQCGSLSLLGVVARSACLRRSASAHTGQVFALVRLAGRLRPDAAWHAFGFQGAGGAGTQGFAKPHCWGRSQSWLSMWSSPSPLYGQRAYRERFRSSQRV